MRFRDGQAFRQAVAEGEADFDAGRSYSAEDVFAEIRAKSAQRRNEA